MDTIATTGCASNQILCRVTRLWNGIGGAIAQIAAVPSAKTLVMVKAVTIGSKKGMTAKRLRFGLAATAVRANVGIPAAANSKDIMTMKRRRTMMVTTLRRSTTGFTPSILRKD